MMESVWLDIQHAARTLRASPLFTTVAVLSLAIGIAGTTIIFGITDAYLSPSAGDRRRRSSSPGWPCG